MQVKIKFKPESIKKNFIPKTGNIQFKTISKSVMSEGSPLVIISFLNSNTHFNP